MEHERTSWVLYDGGCPFCCRAAAWARRRDRRHLLAIIPYKEAPASTVTPALRAASERALHVRTRDGRVLAAGRAAVYVLGELGWRRAARVLSAPPLVWAVEAGYRLVAAHRTRLSKWLRLDCR